MIVNDNYNVVIKWSSKLIDTARGIIYDHHMFIVQSIRCKLVCLFVQVIFCPSLYVYQSQKTLAYYEICQFPVNYEFVMFYSTGPLGQ